MAVSANTLFHFTSLDTLAKIVKSRGFWPRYSKENFKKILPEYSAYEISYIPMVSFCDLRLTQLSNPNISIHTTDFGMYGIGFYKNWGIRNGISPVVYVNSNSITSSLIGSLVGQLRQEKKAGVPDSKKTVKESIPELIKFLKPYDGHYQKGNWKKKIRRYYDEREWRFVPKDRFPVIPETRFNSQEVGQLNNELRKNLLSFSPNDIKFIILKSEDDKVKIAKAIRHSGYTQKDETDLITKIITFKELDDDY